MLKQIFLVRHYLVALVANGGTALEPRGAVGRRFGVETQVVVSGFYREWSTSLARLLNDVQSLCTRQVHDVTRHTKTRSYTIMHCSLLFMLFRGQKSSLVAHTCNRGRVCRRARSRSPPFRRVDFSRMSRSSLVFLKQPNLMTLKIKYLLRVYEKHFTSVKLLKIFALFVQIRTINIVSFCKV